MGTLALAAYEARILALLDDAAQAQYTTAQVDAALRWALNMYSQHRPLIQLQPGHRWQWHHRAAVRLRSHEDHQSASCMKPTLTTFES